MFWPNGIDAQLDRRPLAQEDRSTLRTASHPIAVIYHKPLTKMKMDQKTVENIRNSVMWFNHYRFDVAIDIDLNVNPICGKS